MTSVRKAIHRMRRLWLLEHGARGVLLALGGTVSAVPLCLMLNRAVGLPLWSLWVVAGLAAAALLVLGVIVWRRTPAEGQLAQLLDERVGGGDLYASALEFDQQPERFGWLGELACQKAREQAGRAQPSSRWSLGSRVQWISLATSAAVFGLLFAFFAWRGGDRAPISAPIAAVAAPKPVVVVQNNSTPPPQPETPAASATQPIAEVPDPEPPKPEETVKITNDMIDKYLQEMPQQEVDLTGVTPIRWDEDELSGKANAQNQPRDEKIDPVKLDAALLKDLQTAKKTKEEGGGKEGGVDIAVMKEQGGNLKAKGDKGSDKGALADAVSKDPRGEASRMATRPPLKGFPIRSAARLPTKQKGEDRPMTVLDFLTAVERAKSAAAAVNTDATVAQAGPVEENPVPQEELTEEAGPLAETYFAQLRKADGLAGQASTGGGR